MIRRIATLFAILAVALLTGIRVSEGQGGYAFRIRPLPALPAVCQPGNGEVVYLTTGNTGVYECTAVNTWTRIDSSAIFNVKSFGATGDGVTSDTVAIQAALTAAGAGNVRSTVLIPQGKYNVSSATLTLPPGVTIQGVGTVASGAIVGSVLSSTTAGQPVITITQGASVDVRNTIRQIGIIASTGGCILINNGNQVNIEACYLFPQGGPGISSTGTTQDNRFFYNLVQGTGTNSFSFTGGVHNNIILDQNSVNIATAGNGVYIHCSGARIVSKNNIYQGNGAAGILIDGDVSAAGNGPRITSLNDWFERNTGASVTVNPGAYTTNPPIVHILGATGSGNGVTANFVLSHPLVTELVIEDCNAVGYTGADIALGDMSLGTGVYRIVGNIMSDATKISGTNPTPTNTTVAPFVFRYLPLTTLVQAQLGAFANGTIIYCSDCTIANPCAGGGTGALAKRLNGVWVCN